MYRSYNRWITRFIIPLIALTFITIGRPVPLWQDFSNRDIYFDFLFAVLITSAIWHLVVFSQENLDKRHSWFGNFYKRFLYQGLFGVVIPTMAMMGMYYGYMKLYYHKYFDIERSVFFGVDLPVGLLLILLMNLGLVMIYLIQYNRNSLQAETAPPVRDSKDTPDGHTDNHRVRKRLVTVKGSKNLLLNIDDIAYILLENDISKAYTFDGTSTFIGDPLDTIMSQLPPGFYRANRQTIINLQAVKGYKAERSGRLILEVQPAPATPITVSQKQSVAFKQWLIENS